MDDEKLIDAVRQHPVLYDTCHSKYMDSKYKTQIWKQIGEELKHPAINCKSRWQNMRDQFRKSWAKRAAKPNKTRKYKYEDSMAFVTPYFLERDTSHSQSQADLDCDILFDESSEGNDLDDIPTLNLTRKRKLPQEEATSTTSAKYLVKEEDLGDAEPHPIDAFLSGLAATVKSFSPYYQHLAKGKLFAVVQDMELQQLRESAQETKRESRSPTPTWKTSP